MNERIRELEKLAKAESSQWLGSKPATTITYDELEKFAELIVRECVGVVEGGSFLHDQAPTAIFARECSGAIKRHFGVEE